MYYIVSNHFLVYINRYVATGYYSKKWNLTMTYYMATKDHIATHSYNIKF